jgi:hypothetical protein
VWYGVGLVPDSVWYVVANVMAVAMVAVFGILGALYVWYVLGVIGESILSIGKDKE